MLTCVSDRYVSLKKSSGVSSAPHLAAQNLRINVFVLLFTYETIAWARGGKAISKKLPRAIRLGPNLSEINLRRLDGRACKLLRLDRA